MISDKKFPCLREEFGADPCQILWIQWRFLQRPLPAAKLQYSTSEVLLLPFSVDFENDRTELRRKKESDFQEYIEE